MSITQGQQLLRDAQQLQRAGNSDAAMILLRDALRHGHISETLRDNAGRLLKKAFAGTSTPKTQIHLLGQCTTNWIANSLVAEAWCHGVALQVTDGEYDSVIQELLQIRTSTQQPDALVLLPWNQRLLSGLDRSPEQCVADELAFWQEAWSLLPTGASWIQIGYDTPSPGPLGYHLSARQDGEVKIVREVNRALMESLPAEAYWIDLEQIAGHTGRSSFYDARNYAWTKQPFSTTGVQQIASHIYSGLRALTTGPKKVLVLDLDNTLWGGVVGELGPHGIQLGESPDGEAFRRFQQYVRRLKQQGVVLAVCSKNNPNDAMEPFQVNADMILSLDDVAHFEASWDPKSIAIQRIATNLNLGLDSFVFFDDNPVERAEVRSQLPEVEVVEVPNEPADYIAALEQGLWFESLGITEADRERATQYCVERLRQASRATATSLPEYLKSLEMKCQITPIQPSDMQRVVQLIGKTNQFNLTSRRHAAEKVRELLMHPRSIGLCLRLSDRFGDYGLVSVAMGIPLQLPQSHTNALRLDTWLMSCRAIGRTVEHAFLNHIVAAAEQLGYDTLVGEYVATQKNSQVATFYPEAGFRHLDQYESQLLTGTSVSKGTSAGHLEAAEPQTAPLHAFELTIRDFEPCDSFVTIAATEDAESPAWALP